MKKYRPASANGVNGAAWLGRRLLFSQEQNCRGLQECQTSAWIGHRAEPSKLYRQALRSPLLRFPQDWLLCLPIRYPAIREYHSADSRTYVDSPLGRVLYGN